MPGVVEEIRAWSNTLPYWEQMALAIVASGRDLVEADYQMLLDYFMQDAGLVQMPRRPDIRFPDECGLDTNEKYKLGRLLNLQNVNALAAGQQLEFGAQLTVIYGENGVGKSGYARILACAGFARGRREVLPNVAIPADTMVQPTADIEVSRDGANILVKWEYGKTCRELRGCWVFDANSLPAHLTKSNALTINPAGLSILTTLADVTDLVRERLRTVLSQRDRSLDLTPLFVGSSKIAAHVQSLGADTDLKELGRLSKMGPEDVARITELEAEIAQLRTQDPVKKAMELRRNAADLRSLLRAIEAAEAALGDNALSQVRTLTESLQTAKKEAERSGAEQFQTDLLHEVGTEAWREFVAAAKSLAEAEAKRGAAYPQKDDPCLLCRQPLSAAAVDLIQKLWGFVGSNAAARLATIRASCAARIRELRELSLDFFSINSSARRLLESLAADRIAALDEQIAAYSTRRIHLIASLEGENFVEPPVLLLQDSSQIDNLIASLEDDARAHEDATDRERLVLLENELRELQHRQLLSSNLPSITSYVELKRWVALGHAALGSTRHITTKYNELFQTLVTARFVELFQKNLSRFDSSLHVTVATRGQKGETVREIVLSNETSQRAYSIDHVLSEGEKRAVALADFLTEAELDPDCTGVVIDDPVSSFDIHARRSLARHLVELAATRQVVIFTHDLAFLYELKSQAKLLSVGTLTHWIQRDSSGTPGMVFLDNSPACEEDFKSAQFARERYTKAKVAIGQEQQWLLQQGFGALRSSYEAFVIFNLFEGVIHRFEERISFGRLASVTLDPDIVQDVIARMELLSRFIDAHSHSDRYAAEKPNPAALLSEIEAFENLRKRHTQLKKKVDQQFIAPKKASAPTSAPGTVHHESNSVDSTEVQRQQQVLNQLRPRN